MEVNRDEAARALLIAQNKWQSGDKVGALRLARKSHSLYPTDANKQLIEKYSAQEEKQTPETASTTASKESNGGQTEKEGLRNRATAKGAPKQQQQQKRIYTEEQIAAVKRVMSKQNDYYSVLGVERTATEVEIKKAYRKSALTFHPDKNKAPRADEAFKLVAHAFTVLSDGNKRAHYDRFGVDARSSNSNAPQSRQHQQHPFANAGFRGFDDEISPEDLFNMFFGGDFGQFNVQFGPNGGFAQRGVRFGTGQRPFQQQRQRQQGTANPRGVWASCVQILPLVLLLLSVFGSALISVLFGDDSGPSYAFERSARYSNARMTGSRNVAYWVDGREFARTALDRAPAKLWQYEREIEAQYISHLQRRCRREREHKRNEIYLAQGWLGIGVDKKRLEAAEATPMPACDELRRFR
ncbi:Chaperone protein dnaJ [Coemansia sp. RSA 988]|nr:Chaperone protein dnaJ [Coemansia sp. RSA 988]